MNEWTADELGKIAAANELEISPLRRDGTPRTPVPVWVVRHGDDLFVRSYRGRDGSWFRSAEASRQGHILAGDVGKDVTFTEETDPAVNSQIDTAYRTKYRDYSSTYVDPIVAPAARATTLKLLPR